MMFFPYPLKNVFAVFPDIASKQTYFFQMLHLYMKNDCYQHNLLGLSYKYL